MRRIGPHRSPWRGPRRSSRHAPEDVGHHYPSCGRAHVVAGNVVHELPYGLDTVAVVLDECVDVQVKALLADPPVGNPGIRGTAAAERGALDALAVLPGGYDLDTPVAGIILISEYLSSSGWYLVIFIALLSLSRC